MKVQVQIDGVRKAIARNLCAEFAITTIGPFFFIVFSLTTPLTFCQNLVEYYSCARNWTQCSEK